MRSLASTLVAGAVSSVAQHSEPVWRDKSDFVIAAPLGDGGSEVEQLFVRQISDHRFELCCIPFFLYDVALGDVVETDDTYLVSEVVERSGRYVFRVWFGDSAYPREDIASALVELGGLLEWSSVNLLAIDAEDLTHAQKIADYLAIASQEGKLMFETGRS